MENGDLIDLFIDRPSKKEKLDSIYAGKIRNKDESLQAYFVDIGTNKPGYLPMNHIPTIVRENYPLSEGSYLPVQIFKEAYQDKGPRLTANLTLSNSAIVYQPFGEKIRSSKRLAEEDAQQWYTFFETELDRAEGIIVRSEGSNYTVEEMRSMLEPLRQQSSQIIAQVNRVKRPSLLYERPLVPDQMMNRYGNYGIDRYQFDNFTDYKRMKDQYPTLSSKMEQIKTPYQIAGVTIDQWLRKLTARTITKKNGISLTIDITEALTIIDVDTSTFRTNQRKDIAVFQANQKAVEAAVKEIRRRNLSGIILIDFLKMHREKERVAIQQQMEKFFQQDPVQTKIYGFTKLGLLEMTRKRERAGLHALMKDEKTVFFYRLERELYEYNKQSSVEAIMLKMQPDLYEEWKSDWITRLEKWNTMSIYCMTDNAVDQVEFFRVGSEELIHDWMEENPHVTVDKVL